MSKIINFEEILNKKIEAQNREYEDDFEEYIEEYEKDEYDDLLCTREIIKIMDLSQKIMEKFNVNRDMEKYKEFTKKLIQNYVEYKHPYTYLLPTNELTDEILDNFIKHKLELSDNI